jgi:hypothetical protein
VIRTDEEQAYFDVMQIAGFPISIRNGLYSWDEKDLGMPLRMLGEVTVHATSDITHVFAIFEYWRKRNEY